MCFRVHPCLYWNIKCISIFVMYKFMKYFYSNKPQKVYKYMVFLTLQCSHIQHIPEERSNTCGIWCWHNHTESQFKLWNSHTFSPLKIRHKYLWREERQGNDSYKERHHKLLGMNNGPRNLYGWALLVAIQILVWPTLDSGSYLLTQLKIYPVRIGLTQLIPQWPVNETETWLVNLGFGVA